VFWVLFVTACAGESTLPSEQTTPATSASPVTPTTGTQPVGRYGASPAEEPTTTEATEPAGEGYDYGYGGPTLEDDAADDAPASEAEQVQVVIEDFAFEPAEVVVPVGATIRWINEEESVPHTTTGDGLVWDSGSLKPGESFTFTFTEPGTYRYICAIHPYMTATITVEG
jgi:plastocyanin